MRFRRLAFAPPCAAALPLQPWPTPPSPFSTSATTPARNAVGQDRQRLQCQHKGVKVEFKYLENEAFKAKLPTMLQSNDSRPTCSTAGPAA